MISKKPEDYTIEIGPMGPIGEGEALLLRVNRNCPWNQCLFCPVYKGKRFAIREVDEVKRDIDAARRVCDLLETEVNLTEGKEAIETFIKSHPEIYKRTAIIKFWNHTHLTIGCNGKVYFPAHC